MIQSVLIVEDDKDILFSLTVLLESDGFKVYNAENGLQALEHIHKLGIPDLILLDMLMPVMNGWDFAKAFSTQYNSQTPLIVMTASADAAQRSQAIGASEFISKPFEFENLLSKIRSCEKLATAGSLPQGVS